MPPHPPRARTSHALCDQSRTHGTPLFKTPDPPLFSGVILSIEIISYSRQTLHSLLCSATLNWWFLDRLLKQQWRLCVPVACRRIPWRPKLWHTFDIAEPRLQYNCCRASNLLQMPCLLCMSQLYAYIMTTKSHSASLRLAIRYAG